MNQRALWTFSVFSSTFQENGGKAAEDHGQNTQ
jgi:hypothetical protein